jgi:bacteriocin biosynthesis cyclodehydratase domain-containing protein
VASYQEDQRLRDAAVSAARYAGLPLPGRPRLTPWIIAVDLGDTRLQLRSAESSHTLAHPLLIRVFRSIQALLDGHHTVDEIVSSVDVDVLPTTVVFLLKLLQGNGLLQPGVEDAALDGKEQERWERQLRFLSHFVPDASAAQGMLAKARVGLAGSGGLRHAILSAIASTGIGRITELHDPSALLTGAQPRDLDLIVACQESPAFAFFDGVNRACLVSGTRWLRVAIYGTSAQLGPTVVPNQTACYTCLDLRFQTHQPELDGYLAYRAQVGACGSRIEEGSVAPFWSAIAAQVALEVMRLVTGFAPPVTVGRFFEFGAVSPVAIPHDVLRVPRCTSCGQRRAYAEAWDQTVLPIDLDS